MREEFSHHGFILAAIGSAIGLGNIWRFPYLVGKSGGGAFLIPYVIGILILALPVMLFELSVGRRYKCSVITAFRKINRKWRRLGLIVVAGPLLVLSYYLVVMGWTAMYSLFSLAGEYPEFSQFTGTLQPTLLFLIMAVLTSVIVLRGVKKGIESISKKLMPLLFIFIFILLINSITSPGFAEGMKFYLTPDFSQLHNIDIWILGFSQALFSLSAGMGVLLTYGSYMKRKQALPRATGLIISADTAVALLAGLIIFPIVFSFGLNPGAGPELAFITLPQIFNTMNAGFTIGAIFFFVLFIGAITSAISMLEVPVAALIDEFKFSRLKAVLITSTLLILIGLPSALSYSGFNISVLGTPFLDMMDYVAGSLLVLISCLIITLYINKHKLLDSLMDEINYGSSFKVPYFFADIFHFIVPGIIVMLLIFKII